MPTRNFLLALFLAFAAGAVFADSPNLGQAISEADIKAWDISVLPDGSNLPPGSGSFAPGARLYAEKCAGCHGPGGKGGVNNPLVGGEPLNSRIEATKTIGNFWQQATSVFDYIRRAMPWPNPRSLTDDEVYSLTAYLLAMNKIIAEQDVMNAQTLPKVRMPNRDGFIIRFPEKI